MAFSTKGHTQTALAEINITPLVDVVLVLLLIFMLIPPVLQSGVEVAIPKTRSVNQLTEERMVVTIDREGYITIGDIGRIDDDGFLHLSDRARDMVISGGANIYPAEIEACLLELDGVRDVAVFGIPDDDFGEALAAHLDADPAARLTEDSVRDHVGARLAGFKVPKVVVFDPELPREETGKIFKRRIRQRYWQDAGRNI